MLMDLVGYKIVEHEDELRTVSFFPYALTLGKYKGIKNGDPR